MQYVSLNSRLEGDKEQEEEGKASAATLMLAQKSESIMYGHLLNKEPPDTRSGSGALKMPLAGRQSPDALPCTSLFTSLQLPM